MAFLLIYLAFKVWVVWVGYDHETISPVQIMNIGIGLAIVSPGFAIDQIAELVSPAQVQVNRYGPIALTITAK